MGEEADLYNLGGVSGIPQRTTAMRFSRHFLSYNPGEVANFLASEADELVARGVAAAPIPQPARLTGGQFPNPATTLTALQMISNGSFAVTISGTLREIGPLDFTGASDLNMCAAIITATMATLGTCNTDGLHFRITTNDVGPSATITYASAASSGTSIATTCRWTVGTGAVLTQGS